MQIETRVFAGAEIRAATESGNGIEGLAAVTMSESQDLGGFTEIIEPGAFGAALERSDPVALFNHDANLVLGRFSSGTLDLEERETGLFYRVADLPSARADVAELVRRGDLKGNSFSFTVERDRYEKRDGRNVRIIEEFRELYDVGPVTFPAYPETTLSARTMARLAELEDDIADDAAVRRAMRARRLDLAELG